MFRVIPVIDLMLGQAVAAQGGRRAEYQPLASRLAQDSEPESVIEGLLKLHDFSIIYLADLDALMGGESQVRRISCLLQAYPQLEFWIDAAIRHPDDYALRQQQFPRARIVIGSESYVDANAAALPAGCILSLDYRNGRPYGHGQMCLNPAHWPSQLIALSIDRVGNLAGPDFEQLRTVRGLAGNAGIYSGGGVRHLEDLIQLKTNGVAGALVGRSLHEGLLTSSDLLTLSTRCP